MSIFWLLTRRLGFWLFILTEISTHNVLIFSHVGSHCHVASILAETLIDRGHAVTVVAPNLCFGGRKYRYDIISYPVMENELDIIIMSKVNDQLSHHTFQPAFIQTVMTALLKHSDVILESLRTFQFQVAIVDTVLVDALALVAKLNLPHIILSCGRFDVHLARLTDASLPLSYVPVGRQHRVFTHQMTFIQRAINFWSYFYQKVVINTNRGKMKELRDRFFPEMANLDTDVALRNTTIWIINSDFNTEFPYPVMPNVKYVGSLTARPARSLPKVFKDFMTESVDGVILFSFSTILPLTKTDIAEKFLRAFETLPQRVIWRGKAIQNCSSKIMFAKWIPQNDLLASPKTRVLVTNGGLNGVQEAMYHGVPMVILPLFSDQPDNAIRVEAHGYGVRLDPFNLSPASITAAVESVISDKRIAERMKKVSEKIKFEQAHFSAREMAAYWVEHVMKFGHHYTRPTNHSLSYIQCHGLDVLAASVAICLMVLVAVLRLRRMISREKKSMEKKQAVFTKVQK